MIVDEYENLDDEKLASLIATEFHDKPMVNVLTIGEECRNDDAWLKKIGFQSVTHVDRLEDLESLDETSFSLVHIGPEWQRLPFNKRAKAFDAICRKIAKGGFVSFTTRLVDPKIPADDPRMRFTHPDEIYAFNDLTSPRGASTTTTKPLMNIMENNGIVWAMAIMRGIK